MMRFSTNYMDVLMKKNSAKNTKRKKKKVKEEKESCINKIQNCQEEG